jgi:hypothetical protein
MNIETGLFIPHRRRLRCRCLQALKDEERKRENRRTNNNLFGFETYLIKLHLSLLLFVNRVSKQRVYEICALRCTQNGLINDCFGFIFDAADAGNSKKNKKIIMNPIIRSF